MTALILFTILGCSKTTDDFIYNDDTSSDHTCDEQWEVLESGIEVQPLVCLSWSPIQDEMTWFEAVSEQEAYEGGCVGDCSGDGYCEKFELDGITTWRMPELQEILDASISEPVNPINSYLWSKDSNLDFQDLAWQGNFGLPNVSITTNKDSKAALRCVSD